MKLYKIMFFNMMIAGTLIASSTSSWMTMWMGLEMNLLAIIPLFTTKSSQPSNESAMKYFITQALASLILMAAILLSLTTKEFFYPQLNSYICIILSSALLTKLGAAPFHFWFPQVIEGLNWINSLILLTWQKVAPMILLMSLNSCPPIIFMSIVTSLVMSTVSALNQVSLRKILAFSSINHIAWMLAASLISYPIWLIYIIIYTMLNCNIILTFNHLDIFYLCQAKSLMNSNKINKMMFFTNFMSLGGLPPFIGFLPKWLVINWLVSSKMTFLAFILIMLTLIMMFVYIRVMLTATTLTMTEEKPVNSSVKSPLMPILNIVMCFSLALWTPLFNIL